MFGRRECRKVMRDLQLFLDDQVDEATSVKIASHLETCEECGPEAEVYRQILHTLRERDQATPEVMERLRLFAEGVGDSDL
ncbi:MAG: anti-sigma factor [Acidimicrobiales bacterium]